MLQPPPPPGRMSGRAMRRTILWEPSWLKVHECCCFGACWYYNLTKFSISLHL